MQVHILGGGAIGQLFAFHLTRALRRTPPAYLAPYLPTPPNSTGVTVHLRRARDAKNFNEAGGQVTLTLRDRPQTEQGIIFQGGLGALSNAAPATVRQEGTRFNRHELLTRFQRIKGAVARHELRTHELEPAYQIRQGTPLFGHPSSTSISTSPDDSHIDALFLCTKADVTSFALEPLLPRLSSRSTLVFTQNGLGLADTIIAKHFPDPGNRPWIILSSLTHGLYRHFQNRTDGLYSVHASQGEVHFGILPDPRMSRITNGYQQPAPWPTADSSDQGQEQTQAAEWPPDTLSLAPLQDHFSAQRLSRETAHEAASLVHTVALLLASEELKPRWDTLSAFHRRALRKLAINACINPLTAILECQNGDLIARRQSQEAMPTRAGIDSSESAMTSAERERGAECERIMKSVCQEISKVIQERARRSWYEARFRSTGDQGVFPAHNPAQWSASDVLSPDLILPNPEGPVLVESSLSTPESARPPPVHETLTPRALHTEVIRVLHNVKDNYSSMYQDVVLNGRATSEVSFVNGYVCRLADALNEEKYRSDHYDSSLSSSSSAAAGRRKRRKGWPMKRVDTPVNRMLERLVVAKCDLFGRVNAAHAELTKKAKEAARATAERYIAAAEAGASGHQEVGEEEEEGREISDWEPYESEWEQDEEQGREGGQGRRLFDQSVIDVPIRERVGLRKGRAGGQGRRWEASKLQTDRWRKKTLRVLQSGISRAEGRRKKAVQDEDGTQRGQPGGQGADERLSS